jgi:hypothetical protein
VSFVQQFADGSVADEVVRLVQDELGQWRWFFGRSIEFVNEQIALYASQPSGTAFRGAGLQYTSPGLVAINERPVETGCVTAYPGDGPGFYCGLDMTIYVDVYWLTTFEVNMGDFAWITVLAHEWGHHIQYLLAVRQQTNNLFELQADCLAGSFARDADRSCGYFCVVG